jgi:transcriptional regulator with XRE-family HTH domain
LTTPAEERAGEREETMPQRIEPKSTTIADGNIGLRVRATRLQHGISQIALAKQLGVSFQQVQKYEKGVNKVAASRLMAIAKALKTSVPELIGADGHGKNDVPFNRETYKLAQSMQRLYDLSPQLANRFRSLIDATCNDLEGR